MNLMEYKAERPFAQRHLLCLQEYTPDEILQLLSLAAKLKKMRKENVPFTPLQGKKMAMIFTKPSLRTRVTFEIGCVELGGYPFMLTNEEIGLGKRESVEDVARVLSRMCDGIMIRTFDQAEPLGLAESGSIPVINGLTDEFHPCQALADILTLYEVTGGLKGKKLTFIGDGNNVAASLLIICTKLGIDITVACPKGFDPPAHILAWCAQNAAVSGAHYEVLHDAKEAVKGADVVYTDVWASMGQEAQAAEKNEIFRAFQVNEDLMELTGRKTYFLHCLPAHRGEEVTDAVMEASYSVVFDQAENRLHAEKAVMAMLMGAENLA